MRASSAPATPSRVIARSARVPGCAPQTRVGYDYAHALVDDRSRLAYVELHPDERAATVTAFLERALVFFDRHGIATKRLMTDNAFAYVKNRSLRELLAARGIKHLTTEPYRPRTNGKVCVSRSWCRPIGRRGCSLPSV
jgi:transposase